MLWLTTPMTSPAQLNIGPPELPVLIVAVVWKNSASGIERYAVLGSHLALIQPALNECERPYGAPITSTCCPTRTLSESPSGAGCAPLGTWASWTKPRSAAGSDAITRAGTVSPPRNSTTISSIAWTTCAAVMTLPSAEISTPEPISLKVTRPLLTTVLPLALITTTEGATLRNSSSASWASARPGSQPTTTATNRLSSAATKHLR